MQKYQQNHGGSLSLAKEHIMAAKESGADAVKIQTYTADTMTINLKKNDFYKNWKVEGTITLFTI